MTIKSLQDLNTYAQTPITYNDVRTAKVVFDRGATVDQQLTVSENSEYTFPWGINIEDITQYEIADMEYHIDLTNFNDASVQVNWDYLPAHVTVTRSNNIWIVSDIRSGEDWLYVREARVLPPFGFSGVVQHQGSLQYYSDNQDSSRNIAGWDVDMNITQVQYFSTTLPRTYTSNTLTSNFQPTTILTDPEDFDPVWDLRIYALESNAAIEEMFSDGSAAEAAWNNTTKQYVITGDTESVNEVLATLDIETSRYSADFTLVFRLANNFTNDLEFQVQDFLSRDFISDQVSTSTAGAIAKYFRGFVADPYRFTAGTSLIPKRFRDLLPTVFDSSTTQDTLAFKIPGDHLSTPAFASTIRTNQTVDIDDNPILQNTYPTGVQPNFTVVISTASGIDPVEIYTTGAGTWDNIAKTLTITGSQTSVNSALNNLSIEYDTSLDADTVLRYTATWDFDNPVTHIVDHSMNYAADVQLLSSTRDYFSGQRNDIFDSNTPYADNDLYTNFSVELTASQGDFYYDGTFSDTITLTGTSSTLSAEFEDVVYYPDYGQTGDRSITYAVTKDGTPGQNGSTNINFLGAGSFTNGNYAFTTAGTTTWTPTLEEQLYGEMDYAVVGGGGGGSFGYQTPWPFNYTVHTFNSGTSRSTTQKKFGSHSAYFDGTSNAGVNLGNRSSDLTNFGRWTIQMWIRADNVTQTASLFNSGNRSGTSIQTIEVRQVADEITVELDVNNTNPNVGFVLSTLNANLSADTWHHIHVESYLASASLVPTIAIYVDGGRRALGTTTNVQSNSTDDCMLGNNPSSTQPFLGYIDEFVGTQNNPSPNFSIPFGCSGVACTDYFSGLGSVYHNYYDSDLGQTISPGTFTPPTQAYRLDYQELEDANTVNDIDNTNLASNAPFMIANFEDLYPNNILYNAPLVVIPKAKGSSFGGGGGVVKDFTDVEVVNSSYAVVVGAGGTGGNGSISNAVFNIHGSTGGSSSFNSTTSLGGGGAYAMFDYENDPFYRLDTTYLNEIDIAGTPTDSNIGGGKGGDSGSNSGGRITEGTAPNRTISIRYILADSCGIAGAGDETGTSDGYPADDGVLNGTDVVLNGSTFPNLGAGGAGNGGTDSNFNGTEGTNFTNRVSAQGAGGVGYDYGAGFTASNVNGKEGAVYITTRNK